MLLSFRLCWFLSISLLVAILNINVSDQNDKKLQTFTVTELKERKAARLNDDTNERGQVKKTQK